MNTTWTYSNVNTAANTSNDKLAAVDTTTNGVTIITYPQCTGHAAQTLAWYRGRVELLKEWYFNVPEMQAYKQLHSDWTPPRQYGQLEGVPVGLCLKSRGEAAILGIHSQLVRGIDAIHGESCYAICIMPGKYADDDDHEADGTLIYTGEGGQKKKHHQVEDQTLTVGNAALVRSIDTQLPIRVLRGRKRWNRVPEYYYDGLYRCTGYRYEPSAEGPMVYKFTLVPIDHESKARSIMVASTKPKLAGPRVRLLLDKRKRQEDEDEEEKERSQTDATNPNDDDCTNL